MQGGVTHIIGAGLAGLSAASMLAEAGRQVVVYEASAQAGGRCRSYHDTVLDAVIDNGNHLLLSGNEAAIAYLGRIGSRGGFRGTGKAIFDFVELKSLKRWQLNIGKGKFPAWLFDKRRRVPDTSVFDYLSILNLFRAKRNDTVNALLHAGSRLYQNLWHPVLLSALNTALGEASAEIAATILRDTLLKGGEACIPLVAEGLSGSFIEPALHYLAEHGASVTYSRRVQKIHFEDEKAVRLEFSADETVALAVSDTVICATPSWSVNALLPDIRVPDESRAILNAHFAIEPPEGFPVFMGVVGATTEWIFAFPGRLSVTVSDAGRLMQEDRETLAKRIWQEVAAITGLAAELPTWQIVKEKRATFAATPQQNARRPETKTGWRNVFLAGDYVQTGYPATMEGAILSGASAAKKILKNT